MACGFRIHLFLFLAHYSTSLEILGKLLATSVGLSSEEANSLLLWLSCSRGWCGISDAHSVDEADLEPLLVLVLAAVLLPRVTRANSLPCLTHFLQLFSINGFLMTFMRTYHESGS